MGRLCATAGCCSLLLRAQVPLLPLHAAAAAVHADRECVEIRTCAALLYSGVGLPPFQVLSITCLKA